MIDQPLEQSHRNTLKICQQYNFLPQTRQFLMIRISGRDPNSDSLNRAGNRLRLYRQNMKDNSINLIEVKKHGQGEDYRVKYKLNMKEVKRIISHSGVTNMKVAVISMTGKTRSGKSFILDFFLRYAKHKYVLHKSGKDWMGSRDEPLREGFAWSHGPARETVEITIWPHFFTCRVKGENVCVILMDTQGSHDNESTWQEMAGIFALSTLTSSLQIYNVRNRIDDGDLSHLEKFCSHAGIFSKSGTKPFQKALFLVRDWAMHGFHEYGFVGGNKYLQDEVFREVKEPERLKTRHCVRTYFEDMACFLMPEPGEAAKDRASFEGRLKNLNKPFLEQLDEFIPSVLAAENLVLKKVDGVQVTVEALFGHLQWWVERFNSANISAMAIMVNTTTDIKRLEVKNQALTVYAENMDEFCKSRLHFSRDELFASHVLAKEAALNYFNTAATIADEATIRTRHKQTLLDEIEQKYAEYLDEYSYKLFERDRVVYLPCIAVPVFTLCYAIDRNSWMTSDLPYKATILLFWISVAIMGYWTMLILSWFLSGCTRTTVNILFWAYVGSQVYNQLFG